MVTTQMDATTAAMTTLAITTSLVVNSPDTSAIQSQTSIETVNRDAGVIAGVIVLVLVLALVVLVLGIVYFRRRQRVETVDMEMISTPVAPTVASFRETKVELENIEILKLVSKTDG